MECGVTELDDVMLSVIIKVNAPSAVGSSALLAHQPRRTGSNDVSNKAAQPIEYELFISCYLRDITISSTTLSSLQQKSDI